LDDLLVDAPLGFGVDPDQPDVFTLVIAQTGFELCDGILQAVGCNWLATVPRAAAEAALVGMFGGDLIVIFQ
jgi:hypothetical protein